MQRLEVSGVVRLIYRSLGVKGLNKRSKSNKTVFFFFALKFSVLVMC